MLDRDSTAWLVTPWLPSGYRSSSAAGSRVTGTGHSVDLGDWLGTFDELMTRTGSRFRRVEPRRRGAGVRQFMEWIEAQAEH
jgi:hypothetical protein